MTERRVAVLAGSLRKESFSRKVAAVLASQAPEFLKPKMVEIGTLPLYNEDLEAGQPPEAWRVFRNELAESDGLLFVTPEYNRSVPAVLKNALDVGSRPFGKSVWSRKPGAVMSISSGALGGFGANHHLRQSLTTLNVRTMQQPEAYIGNVAALFDEKGGLVSESFREFAVKFMQEFGAWVEMISTSEKNR